MKKISIFFVVLLIMSMVLTACGGAKKSTTLNLYAWSEYVPQQLLDDFTTKYGITVNYDTYSSNEEMLAKLQAGSSGYDVIIPSDYTVAIMISQKMLEPIDVTKLANFKTLTHGSSTVITIRAINTPSHTSGERLDWYMIAPRARLPQRIGLIYGTHHSIPAWYFSMMSER